MTDYRRLEKQLADDLQLRRRPVAITFSETPPSGVSRFTGTAPSGCTFWRLASEGRTFYTVYAPLGDTPVDPDVVLFWGPAARVMLLQEAAIRSGVAAQLNTLGRPTCMALPAALASGMVVSTGCVGNRVYTSAEEGELYAAVPGRDLERLAAATGTISSANAKLLEYHRGRRLQLGVD